MLRGEGDGSLRGATTIASEVFAMTTKVGGPVRGTIKVTTKVEGLQ